MPETTSLELRLDLADERLWRGRQAIRLKPKVFALLRYFVEHPKRLLTKDDILAAIWPDTCVSEELIKDYVQQLRRALIDDIKRPRFIETVWGRGYRYIGEISLDERSSPVPALSAPLPAPEPLGRNTELAELRRWWGETLSGARRLVFVSGEPGIGKTTLVNAFLAERASEGWIAQGKGVEFYGIGEAFLPILEALEQLCRRVDGKPVIACLKEHAPTWLLQLPVAIDDRTELQRRAQGASRERMLRELAQALETLAAERGLILCLEDLHWTDDSTLEVLVYLAQRRQPARLLLISTYRPVDMCDATNALARLLPELRTRGHCGELPLALLNEAVITQYLARHFPGLPAELARPLRRQSGGNPLFLVNVLEYLRAQGVIAQAEGRWTLQDDPQVIGLDIPPTLQQLIEQRLERFSMADQRLLETASAAGFAFTAEALAAGLAEEQEAVDERCAQLSRRAQWLRASGEERWPQGTVTTRYEFLHALYQQVLYRRVTPVRRARVHQCIGERLELGYGEQPPAIAAELAGHFERAGDQVRSVRYLGQAAQTALGRHAYSEASEHLNQALALLAMFPATAERDRQELGLQMMLGAALARTGYSAPEMARAFDRAKELSQHLGDADLLISAQLGLIGFNLMRANYWVAHELGERCIILAHSTQDRNYLPPVCGGFGEVLLMMGGFTRAHEYLEQGFILYDPQRHHRQAMEIGTDPGILCLSNGAAILWFLGHPDQAVSRIKHSVTLARELAHPFSLVLGYFYATMIYLFRREPEAAQAEVEAARAVALKYEFPLFLADTQIQQGWILAQQGRGDEGIGLMHKGLADRERLSVRGGRTLLLGWLVEACAEVGRIEEGLATLAEALAWAEETGECWYEAEYYRLRGELLLQQAEANAAPAEACFQQALTVARRQQTKSWELRAATSLARLWREQGKSHAAYELLAPVYSGFNEGFAMSDLRQAQALLVKLS